MRKSNSLLNNLADSAGQVAGGYPAMYPGAPHAAAFSGQPGVYPAPGNPYHGGFPHAHPAYAAPPADPYAVPQPTQEFSHVKTTLDSLSERLNAVAQMQNQVVQASARNHVPSQAELTGQVQTLAATLAELRSAIGGIKAPSSPNDALLELKAGVEQLREEVRHQTENAPDNRINPGAYAQVVEKSHSDILSQIREIQRSVEASAINPSAVIQAIEERQGDLVARLDSINEALVASGPVATGDEFSAMREQLVHLDAGLAQLTASLQSQPDIDFAERLDEITRGILALSAGGSNVDSLERIEARIMDFSKELKSGSVAGSAAISDAGFDPAVLEPYFAQTLSTLKAFEDRLAGIEAGGSGGVQGGDSDLVNSVAMMAEQLSNLSAVAGSTGESGTFAANPELLLRLDTLVSNVEEMRADRLGIDNLSAEVRSLEEQISALSVQLDNPPTSHGEDGQAGPQAAFSEATLERLEAIVGRMDELSATGSGADNSQTYAAMQEQLSVIASNMLGSGEGNPLSSVEERLDGIEKQLVASRDIGIEVAAGAAEEAVRKVMSEMPASQTAFGQLLGDIRNLVAAGNGAGQDAGVLRSTLDDIAAHISLIEAQMQGIEAGTLPPPAHDAGSESHPLPPTEVGGLESDLQPAEPELVDTVSTQPAELASPTEMLAAAAQAHRDGEAEQLSQPASAPVPNDEPPTFDPQEYDPVQDPSANRALSPGEMLVQAARQAEDERQRAKIGHEEEFANSRANETPSQLDSGLSDSIIEPEYQPAAAMPDVVAPQLSTDVIPEVAETRPQPPAKEEVAIEPGSGGPDLAALVRQANDRRKALSEKGEGTGGTDFLAAARRAAQAAALEAKEIENQEVEEKKPTGLLGGIPNLLSRNKKAVIGGALAILLTALAVPIVSNFSAGEGGMQLAEVNDEIQPTTATEQEFTVAEPVDDALPTDVDLASVQPVPTETELPVTEASLSEVEPEPVSGNAFAFDPELIAFAPDALRQAALEQDPVAIFEIARRFTNGTGTEKNLDEAAIWYEKAASMGVVPAQYVIGNFYEKGIGVTKDQTIARAWYEQAASGGHVVSMHNLGVMSGSPDPDTGQTDYPDAVNWFSKAADYGVRDSQVNLGIFLAKGNGAEVDLVESYKWFAIAAKTNDPDATQKRDFVAKALRPDQLEEAKRRVDEWKQREPLVEANEVTVPPEWNAGSIALLNDPQSIAKAQTLLSKIGFDVGPADGVVGAKTRQAIELFRSRSGLPVNQKIDSELMDALLAVAI